MVVPELSAFYALAVLDNRLNARHISLYMALFEYWNKADFQSPVTVRRAGLMELAKISGLATYHKTIRELHEYGYIRYAPSFHPGVGSLVYLVG